ncbi:unnamed protein product [Darwinula stevensoni]|uniref:Uncharacterized protein n=1 Tax=Darwinula stevensoni TaxID=69355 RepID=A0A7R9AG58_9CRUS|nr:unnamed protein product [Darwinula stevensoni]CAG0903683.1 unnamed protein product [Darwinula stevensoni]
MFLCATMLPYALLLTIVCVVSGDETVSVAAGASSAAGPTGYTQPVPHTSPTGSTYPFPTVAPAVPSKGFNIGGGLGLGPLGGLAYNLQGTAASKSYLLSGLEYLIPGISAYGNSMSKLLDYGNILLGIASVVLSIVILVLVIKAGGYDVYFLPSKDVAPKDRKRRAIEGSEPHVSDSQLASLAKVVLTALEAQECQQRMFCEIGYVMRDYGAERGLVMNLLERFSPKSMSELVKKLKAAALGKEECTIYKCGSLPSKEK